MVAIGASFTLAAGCGSGGASDPFVRAPGADANADAADANRDASIFASDSGLDDPSLGGPCLDDGQCNDSFACTFDRCDLSITGASIDGGVGRCRYTPDDAQCADGEFCNGRERCILGLGCRPGPVETCQDNDSCTVDTCIEAQKACAHAPRDLDGDGDPDDRCAAKRDCDDQNPDVASTRAEICGNGTDDDCDSQVDEAPCSTASADTCATAIAITAAGTYALSTVAATSDFAVKCAAAGKDVVAQVTIPAGGGPKDLDLWLTAPGVEIALAVQGTCGTAQTELGCRAGLNATRTRIRNLAPGTYAVIVKTTNETAVELAVDFLAPTPAPTNETCANAKPITVGTPFTVSLVDPAKDLPSACTLASGELTYSFTLAAPADIRAYATVLRGASAPVLGLRKASCTTAQDEIRCREDASLPLFARALPAGNYVLSVGAAQSIDASVLVTTSTPTTSPANEACSGAPAATPNTTTVFDLDAHDDDVKNGCFEGNPDAAYTVTLTEPSDVLLVARFPNGDTGAIALETPACSAATSLVCTVGGSPVRASVRNVAAGSYRAVVADRQGRLGSLLTLVRPTAVPVDIKSSDACGSASLITIPPGGGYFVGDTTNASDEVSNGCDQAGAPQTPDLIMRLDLTQARRVVLDMSGSTYTTLLSVREGALCPGLEVAGACHVGFGGGRSFLDRVLPTGTYWLVIDGFNGERGSFALDVRTLSP